MNVGSNAVQTGAGKMLPFKLLDFGNGNNKNIYFVHAERVYPT